MNTGTVNPSVIDFYKKYGCQVIEEFKTGNTKDLPLQQGNLDIGQLEYSIKQIWK